MGTVLDDFVHAYKETSCIAGLPEEYGGGGETSIPTALGVLYSIQAVANTLWGNEDLAGKKFAVQGLGKVGFKVAEHLLEQGADLYVTDVSEEAVQALLQKAKQKGGKAAAVKGEDIYGVEADMFVPCAIGGIINDRTIEQLKVKGIAGAANNQLLHEGHARVLRDKGILYAPDYIVNSGGVIQVADELYGPNKKRVLSKTKNIYYSILEVLQQAENENVTTVEAANLICEKRLEAGKNRDHFFSPNKRPKWQIRR